MEHIVIAGLRPGERQRRAARRRGRHAAGAGLARPPAASEHVDTGGFCRCCGCPFPCSTARRQGAGREPSELVGPALGETPGAGLTLQEPAAAGRERGKSNAATIPVTVTTGAGSQLTVPAVDVGGRAIAVQVAVRRDTVELWCAAGRRSVLDRDAVRAWLPAPWPDLVADDVTLSCAAPGRVALSVTGVLDRWTLAPHVLDALRDRI